MQSLAALLVLGLASPLFAQPSGVAREPDVAQRSGLDLPRTRLRLERGDGAERCVGEPELRAAVADRLGYDPFADDAGTEMQVTFWRAESGKLTARVARVGEGGAGLGTRTLESGAEDCAELASATSFAIAVAIDPTSVDRDPGAPPRPNPPPAPRPGAPAAPPAPPPRASPPRAAQTPVASAEGPSIRPFIGAAAHVAFLAAPDAAAGGTVHAGLRVDWASVAVEGRFDAEARGADPDAAGEVGSRLTLLSLVPCGHVGPAAFCGLASVGVLDVQGYGVDVPRRDSAILGSFGPRVGAELPLLDARLALFAEGEARVTLPRATVELDERRAYRQSPAHLLLAAGLRLYLGELGKSAPAPAR